MPDAAQHKQYDKANSILEIHGRSAADVAEVEGRQRGLRDDLARRGLSTDVDGIVLRACDDALALSPDDGRPRFGRSSTC